ncbi:leucine-rich repeat receptor-like protein kinase [Populus alba x Populus x berolinensis]|nr:leucine-rich repeat receptor-like protein kinase [Populus alba x Populus x berolinensis]
MCPKVLTFLLVASFQIYTQTYGDDFTVMSILKDAWENTPRNWVGADPCGGKWEGISCNNSRVTSITLAAVGLMGELSGDISSLSELEFLDLSYNTGLSGTLPASIVNLKKLKHLKLVGCSFYGPIPELIGSLQLLESLDLNSNGFTGQIPHSIGNLSKLILLDLSDNQLDGAIPVSSGTTPGLDMLVNALHFHLGRNQFSGAIPNELFRSDMTLIHVLLHDNNLTGSIPSTLGLVHTLEAVRFEGNSLTGPVPSNLNNLTNVTTLILSNNKFTGPVPNLTGMAYLCYLDLSNNIFDASDFPVSFSNLRALKTLMMENTGLEVYVNCPTNDSLGYLESNVSVFPSGQNHFNTTTISGIGFVLNLQTIENPGIFGPSYFKGAAYPYFDGKPAVSNKLPIIGGIVGAAAGGASFLLLLLLAGVYAYRLKKRRERACKHKNHFAYLDLKNSDRVPQLKGARCFSFDEITKSTNNFSEANHIGSGGYGMASLSLFSCPALVVYRGMLPTGQLIAIKRCRQGSVQGGHEFNAEIEVLSRVHHKNVVNLVGFCFERGEQMLIYEFVRNGSLRDSLSDTMPKGLDKMVDLAMKCVQEKGRDRPTMGEVVKEIELILYLAGLNPDAEAESTSASFEEASQDEFPPSLKEEELSLS